MGNIGAGGMTLAESGRVTNLVSDVKKLVIPTYDGSGEGVHPSVVYIPKGWNGYKYWMAFTPYYNGNNDYENPSVVASNNGDEWVVPDGLTNPIVPAFEGTDWNFDPELIYDGTNLIMYWGDSTGKYYRKTSSNGTTWGASEEVTITGEGIAAWNAPGIVRESATSWKAWSIPTVSVNNVNPGCIVLFISSDGINWTVKNVLTTNMTLNNWHLSVFGDDVGYHFLVSAYPKGKTNGDCNLYYGYSEDGLENIVFQSEPILSTEIANWTNGEIYRSCFARGDNQSLYLYFSARQAIGTGSTWGMGRVKVKLNNPLGLISALISKRPRVRKVWVYSGKEIRDTNAVVENVYSKNLELYANKALMIRNSHDQAINLSIATNIRTGGTDFIHYGIPSTNTVQTIQIPTGVSYKPFLLTSEHLPALAYPIPMTYISMTAASSPTTGSIDVILIEWN